MEVKELSPFSGRNQCVARRKARRKVEKQTKFYMHAFRQKHPKVKSILGISVAGSEWNFFPPSE